MSFFQRSLRRFFPPTEFKRRLYDKLPVLGAEIESFKLEAGADWNKKPWLKIADNLFSDLKDSVDKYEIQQGWKIYKSIGRMLIHGLAEQEGAPHLSRARSIFYEALGKMEKDSWRRKSILDLVGKSDKETPEQWSFNIDAKVEDIIKANEILDEHQDNFYDKLLTLNGQIRLLTWTALLAIALFIYLAPKIGDFPRHNDLPPTVVDQMTEFLRRERNRAALEKDSVNKPLDKLEQPVSTEENSSFEDQTDSLYKSNAAQIDSLFKVKERKIDSLLTANVKQVGLIMKAQNNPADSAANERKKARNLAILVILMGIIGAVVSGFLGIIQTGTENTVPNQLFGTTILISRLVVATVAALAVYIFLGTGLMLLFSSTISFELLLAFCFIAGTSEKLVKKGITTLTKEEMYKGQKPK